MPHLRLALATALSLVLWTAGAFAVRPDLVTVTELLAEPDKWHGRSVVVSGSVEKLEAKTSQRGNPYYTFLLTDGVGSVTVFSFGTPEVRDGRRVRVEGTFLKVKRVGKEIFHNQVVARQISIL